MTLIRKPITKYFVVVLYKSYKIKILSTTFKYSNFSTVQFFTSLSPLNILKLKKIIISKLDQSDVIFGSLYSCGLHIHTQTQMTRFLFQHIRKLQLVIQNWQKVRTVIYDFVVLEPESQCLQATVYQNANNFKH